MESASIWMFVVAGMIAAIWTGTWLYGKYAKKGICSICSTKGEVDICSHQDCDKKYCKKCAKAYLKECEDCESLYCPEHLPPAAHNCETDEGDDEDDDEANDDDDEETYYSDDKKYAMYYTKYINTVPNKMSSMENAGYEFLSMTEDDCALKILFRKKGG